MSVFPAVFTKPSYPTQQVTSDMQATSYTTQSGVPGQTFYGHQPAPVSYVIPVQNPNSSSGVSQNFNGAAGRATGWLHLSLGIGCIVVAIAELVLGLGAGFCGMGIWASVLVICLFSSPLEYAIVPYMINTFAMTLKINLRQC